MDDLSVLYLLIGWCIGVIAFEVHVWIKDKLRKR